VDASQQQPTGAFDISQLDIDVLYFGACVQCVCLPVTSMTRSAARAYVCVVCVVCACVCVCALCVHCAAAVPLLVSASC
jgi:hypothetical protein